MPRPCSRSSTSKQDLKVLKEGRGEKFYISPNDSFYLLSFFLLCQVMCSVICIRMSNQQSTRE